MKYVDGAIAQRQAIAVDYQSRLERVTGVEIVGPFGQEKANYSYFPILITDEFCVTRDELYESLKSIGIYTRRYFYPLISEFPMYRDFPSSDSTSLPVAFESSNRILCLPIFPGLESSVIKSICEHIAQLRFTHRVS